jgi:hypothetical protein
MLADGVRVAMTYLPFKYWKERLWHSSQASTDLHASLDEAPPSSSGASFSSAAQEELLHLSLPTSCSDAPLPNEEERQLRQQAHISICNVFWKPSLTFHPFVACDAEKGSAVDFASLWASGNALAALLLESRAAFGSGVALQELALITLRMGPLRVLQIMLQNNLIGDANQPIKQSCNQSFADLNMKFDDGGGGGLLHKACLAQNAPAALFLTSVGIAPTLKDRKGRSVHP